MRIKGESESEEAHFPREILGEELKKEKSICSKKGGTFPKEYWAHKPRRYLSTLNIGSYNEYLSDVQHLLLGRTTRFYAQKMRVLGCINY
jgi:hypothetical protein